MDDTTGESYVENAAGAAVTATGFARATAAVVLAILLAVAPVNVTGDSDTFSARERASYVVTVYRDVAVLLAET